MKCSVKEAAELLGVSEETVRARIRRGELEGEKVANGPAGKYVVYLDKETVLPGQPLQDMGLAELVAFLEKLQEQNRKLAVQVGRYRARTKGLEKQVRFLRSAQGEQARPWWKWWPRR